MNTAQIETQPGRMRRWLHADSRAELKSDKGAVGTEMAIVVAIVVAIAIALGAAMTSSAESHQDCIPPTPGATVPTGCDSVGG